MTHVEHEQNPEAAQRSRDLERLSAMVGHGEPFGKLFVNAMDEVRANPSDQLQIRYEMVESALFSYLHATDPEHRLFRANQEHLSNFVTGSAMARVRDGFDLVWEHAVASIASSARAEILAASLEQHDMDAGFYASDITASAKVVGLTRFSPRETSRTV